MKRSQGTLEKRVIPEIGQGRYEASLELHVVLKRSRRTNDGPCRKDLLTSVKGVAGQSQALECRKHKDGT